MDEKLQQGIAHLPVCSVQPDIVRKTGNGEQYAAIVSEGATYADFTDYANKLTAAGYTLYACTEFHGDTDETKNYFATYTNDQYVVRIEYHAFEGRMFINTDEKTADTVLHPTSPKAYRAVGAKYPTMVTQFGIEDLLKEEGSMCYIIRTADGKFVIIDAAAPWGSGDNTAGDRIYRILRHQAPDPEHIVIAAWFITHAHGDHHGGFLQFSEKYAKDPAITLEQVYYNFPADEALTQDILVRCQYEFIDAVKPFGNVEHVRVHTGDVICFADIQLQVLYTQVNQLAREEVISNFNASSLVLRLVCADGSTVVFGADHPVQCDGVGWLSADGALYKWYGTFLQSDAVSTFHHGYGGGAGKKTIYETIDPSIVLWDIVHYRVELNNLTAGSANNWFYTNEKIKTLIAADGVQTLAMHDGKIDVKDYEDIGDYLSDQPMEELTVVNRVSK